MIVAVDPAEVRVVTAAARGEPGGAWQLRDDRGQWVHMGLVRAAMADVFSREMATGSSLLGDPDRQAEWMNAVDDFMAGSEWAITDPRFGEDLRAHMVEAMGPYYGDRAVDFVQTLRSPGIIPPDQIRAGMEMAEQEGLVDEEGGEVAEVETEEGGPAQAEPLPVSEYTPEQQQVAGDAVARVQGLVDDGVFTDSALVPAQLRGGTAALLNQMATGQLYDPETGFPVTSFQSMSDAVAGRVIRGYLGEGLSDGDVLAYQTAGGEIEARLDGVPTSPIRPLAERLGEQHVPGTVGLPTRVYEAAEVLDGFSVEEQSRWTAEQAHENVTRALDITTRVDGGEYPSSYVDQLMRELGHGNALVSGPGRGAAVGALAMYADDDANGLRVRTGAEFEPENDRNLYDSLFDPDGETEEAQERLLTASSSALANLEGQSVDQAGLVSALEAEGLSGDEAAEVASELVDFGVGVEPDMVSTRELAERFGDEYRFRNEIGTAGAETTWHGILGQAEANGEIGEDRINELWDEAPRDLAAEIDEELGTRGVGLPGGKRVDPAKAGELMGSVYADTGTEAGAVYFEVSNISNNGDEIVVYADIMSDEFGRIGDTEMHLGDGGNVHAARMVIDSEFQGHGAATAIQIEAFEMLRNEGFATLTVTANLDVGGFTWAKNWEFADSDSKMASLLDRIEQRTMALGPASATQQAFGIYTPEQRDQVLAEIDQAREDMAAGNRWPIKRVSEIGKDLPYGTSSVENDTWLKLLPGDPSEKWHHWPGKAGLLGASWTGAIQL